VEQTKSSKTKRQVISMWAEEKKDCRGMTYADGGKRKKVGLLSEAN